MNQFGQVVMTVVVISSIIVSTFADSGENGFTFLGGRRTSYRNSYGSDEYEVPRYRFAYRTRAGRGYGDGQYKENDVSSEFGHAEKRDGDRTDGKYYVQLPDGRLQIVRYYVDGDSGYVAHVSYGGESGADDGPSYESK